MHISFGVLKRKVRPTLDSHALNWVFYAKCTLRGFGTVDGKVLDFDPSRGTNSGFAVCRVGTGRCLYDACVHICVQYRVNITPFSQL